MSTTKTNNNITNDDNKNDLPHIAVVGGGPAGFLVSLLVARKVGIRTTILEQASEPDPWSTKSYSIVLGERGINALSTLDDCFEAVQAAGMERQFVFFMTHDGEIKAIPKKTSGIGMSRPLLVQCLEDIAAREPLITIQRGASVQSIQHNDDNTSTIHLQSGSTTTTTTTTTTTIQCTHVIGADGKWSNTRQSVPELQAQATIQTEPAFGVHMMVDQVPEGWKTNGTYVIRPNDEDLFYIIAAPIPSGELSVSMVCFDEITNKYPWLAAPDDASTNHNNNNNGTTSGTWEDEYSALPAGGESQEMNNDDFATKLKDLLQTTMPAFLSAIGTDALKTARINRRTSWLKMTPASVTTETETSFSGGGQVVTFTSSNGRVTLIGDAAHAMTPSMGEGCNTALESAVRLVDCILLEKDLSKAFLQYGTSRPPEVQPIQEKSAMGNRYDAKKQ